MLDPVSLMLPRARDGLYECLSFRAQTRDGRYAFWLRHNLLRRHGERGVSLELSLVLFDRQQHAVAVASDREDMGPSAFSAFARGHDWDNVSATMGSGSFFGVARERLHGRLHGSTGRAAWNLALTRSDDVLFHFPHERLYQLPLPRKKLLTRDTGLCFSGSLKAGDIEAAGDWVGTSGHNWGTEHAREYAYACCSQFTNAPDVRFDGFTARLALAAGLLRTPPLSMASLRHQGEWLHFNALSRCYQQKVRTLSDYHWAVTFTGEAHRLELTVDGGNPRLVPWAALNYEHPGCQRSVVKHTPFARGTLRLSDLQGQLLAEYTSPVFELETLLPDNLPSSSAVHEQP